jgi:hypothetical protein
VPKNLRQILAEKNLFWREKTYFGGKKLLLAGKNFFWREKTYFGGKTSYQTFQMQRGRQSSRKAAS